MSPAPVNNNVNTNNNNSSATANVVINAAAATAPATTKTVSTVVGQPAATVVGAKGDVMLPQTGPEDMIVGGLGLGSMVAASAMYLNSRRDLLAAFYKR